MCLCVPGSQLLTEKENGPVTKAITKSAVEIQKQSLKDVAISFQAERASFLHCGEHFLIKHGERVVWREIQTIKACVSSVNT